MDDGIAIVRISLAVGLNLHNEIAATSKTFPAKNRVRGKKQEADPTSTWGRPKTLGKNQAYALSGTAVVGAQATEERFAE